MGTRGVPMACSIPQSEQFSPSQTLDGGFLLQKKNYKSDKIKVIFIWEVKSELPARSWALGPHHFCCSLGGAGNLCGVNRGAAPTITTVKHLYSMMSKPSLTSSQPG